MNKKFLAMAALALITTGTQAKVKLPHILGDNMILQQNTEASLWGWDKPGTTVEVTTSWSGQKYSAKTGKDGKWAIKVQTPKASYTPLSITFDDGEKTTLNNVLAGEVWVCAGQSNMEMPVKGFGNCPVEGYNKAVLEANQYKGVHYVKIPSVMSSKPLDDANCEWKEVNPETVGDASATGYFFAQVINKTLDIPVGLVMANKGGSRVESWLDRDYLKKKDPRLMLFVVHRLDRDTSGLMMFAKNVEAKEAMQHNWNNMVLGRRYVAVVEGKVEQEEGVVKSYLAETSQFEVYSTQNPDEGQLAITRFKRLQCNNGYSLMELSLDTGRKNQIRVHMKDLGHPIVGDRKYGAKASPIHRLGLHARTLHFAHPVTKKEMLFETPIPSRFLSLLK